MPDYLNEVLNKLCAMKTCGIVTLKEIANGIGEKQERVSEWVTQRRRIPNGEVALKLSDFASHQTIRIAMNPKVQAAYRAEFSKARSRFPDGGRK